jgi:hypothetical protein
VLAMGVLYHVYDHPRFIKNLYRITKSLLVLEGECSGRSDKLCQAHMEPVECLRSSIYGPVIYPSVSWMIDLMRWVGFRDVKYVAFPDDVSDRDGYRTLNRAMLVGQK